MPQSSSEWKRTYNRLRQRRIRGYKGAVQARWAKVKGDEGNHQQVADSLEQDATSNVVSSLVGIRGDRGEKGVVPNVVNVVPSRKWDAATWWGWHQHLVTKNEALEVRQRQQEELIASMLDRETLLEADLARLEVMISFMIYETEEGYR